MGCPNDQSTRFWQAGLDLFLALDFHVPIEDAGKWRDAAVEVAATETRLLVQPSDGRKLTTRRESGQKNRPGMARPWDALGVAIGVPTARPVFAASRKTRCTTRANSVGGLRVEWLSVY